MPGAVPALRHTETGGHASAGLRGSGAPRTPRPWRAGTLPPPSRLRGSACFPLPALNHGFSLCPCCEKCPENTAAKFLRGMDVGRRARNARRSSGLNLALPGIGSGWRGDRLHPPLLPIVTLFSPRSIAIQQRSSYRRNFRTFAAAYGAFRPRQRDSAGIPAGHHLRAAAGAGQLPATRCGLGRCSVPCSHFPSRLFSSSQVSSLSGGAAALQRLLLGLGQGAASPHVPGRESCEDAK